ncbi:MAG: quinoprotein dehydrogenase-associated putative ABC transporter substrate-binding protein [Sinobacteraceae bacterium]|nr:quinoprotein dehydrogenase-associated putative ABC transporter substrate-binding protein [Nevskiaceae bacterium]
MHTIVSLRAAVTPVVAVVMTALTAPFAAAQGKMSLDAQSQKNIEAQAQQSGSTAPEKADPVLRVCADPSSLPQSNDRGEGYENKIAEALAHDLGKKVEYTYFPQRMGFVRNTLRSRDEQSLKFKCDLIIGVPKGYDLTATTRPYMHSTYALVFSDKHADFRNFKGPEDLLALPPEKLRTLRIGIFGHSPAADWLLQNNLLDRAAMYAPQSGDPKVTPNTVISDDLSSGKIDVAIVWGPVAGQLLREHPQGWGALPFKPDPKIKFDYEISMGLRQGEKEWKDTLDEWIGGHQSEIHSILVSYQIPLLDLS